MGGVLFATLADRASGGLGSYRAGERRKIERREKVGSDRADRADGPKGEGGGGEPPTEEEREA